MCWLCSALLAAGSLERSNTARACKSLLPHSRNIWIYTVCTKALLYLKCHTTNFLVFFLFSVQSNRMVANATKMIWWIQNWFAGNVKRLTVTTASDHRDKSSRTRIDLKQFRWIVFHTKRHYYHLNLCYSHIYMFPFCICIAASVIFLGKCKLVRFECNKTLFFIVINLTSENWLHFKWRKALKIRYHWKKKCSKSKSIINMVLPEAHLRVCACDCQSTSYSRFI